MQHGQRVRFKDQASIEVEIKIETTIGFGFIDSAGHQQIGGVVIAFGLDQACLKSGKFRIDVFQLAGEDLEFLATAPFNQAATDEMIDGLVTRAVAN